MRYVAAPVHNVLMWRYSQSWLL